MENQTILRQLSQTDYAHFWEKGISYEDYLATFIHNVETKADVVYAQYLPMNLQRTKRVSKTMKLLAETIESLEKLDKKVKWLVISEAWCGDASQIMPVFQNIVAASNGQIEMRIIYRDREPDLIAAHLTNGGKAVPKLIQMSEDFSITATWGPRPKVAQELVLELRSKPDTLEVYAEHLHKWYADDKTVSTQKELVELLGLA